MRYLALIAVVLSMGFAQNYRCDWSVVGIGGGDMAGSSYKCGTTAGQTAAGPVTGAYYRALVGFWQPEGQTGVREQAELPGGQTLVTRLYAPAPNPSRSLAAIRYSLAVPTHASLTVHDLAGRLVRTLANLQQGPGRYSACWDGRDALGRELADGVYFLRFSADEYLGTEKLVLQR